MKHIKIVITLTVVVLIASVMVFYVEGWTTPIIDNYNFEQANLAKFEVLPLLDGNDSLDPDLSYDFTGTSITELIVIPGKGYIYTAEFQGFQSIITYMIGIDTNGTITGYKTLIQGDTPGLGAEIGKDWYKDQFPGTSINDLSGIDGWTGATITFGGSKVSLSKVMDFHNSTFEGVVLETPAEKLARWKKEITVDNAVITDVSADYTLADGLTKVELANDGSTNVAVIYTVEFTGYNGIVEYIIAFDLDTNDIIGFRVVNQTETGGLGAEIANPDYYVQFEDLAQADALAGNIDALSGATITTGGLKSSLVVVANFHQAEFEGAVLETFDEKVLRWKKEITVDNAVITDVSGDHTLSGGILKVEIANDGSKDVAVIYTLEFTGYNPSETVEYFIAFDLDTNDIIGFRVLYQSETPGLGAKIADESYFVQFDNLLQADALSGNIDGLSGATITTGGLKGSLVEVVNFHQAEFQGVVVETPEEILARWKTEITVANAVITDVSADHTLISEVTKVEIANDGSTDVAVIYTVEFDGYIDVVEYIIAFDLVTNDIIGFRVVYENETNGLGAKIAEPTYFVQFEDLAQADALSGNIDGLSGATVTTTGLKVSLNKVVTFHKVEFEGEVIVIPDPVETGDANLLLAFPGASTFTSVYADYTYVEDILNIYEVKDATDELIGYVYFGHVKGFGVNNIEFAWGVDVYGVTVEIAILNDTQSWDDAASSEWSDYDGSAGLNFNTTTWLNNFEGVTLQSLLDTAVDGVAGVSTTTGAMIEVTQTIAQYHLDEFEIVPSLDFATTSDANLLLALPGAVTFTSVYGDYTFNDDILNMYEARDGSDAIVGYVYYGHADGFGAANIQFVLGVGVLYSTVEIAILNVTESWDQAEEWASYTGSAGLNFNTTTWLNNFEGVTLQSLLDTAVDGVAGVSTTTGAMISVIEGIAQYHSDESVGGGS